MKLIHLLTLAALSIPSSLALAQSEAEKAVANVQAPATKPNTDPVVHEIELNAPIQKVWDVFATEPGWKSLGVAQVKLDLRVGGKVQTHYNPAGVLGDEGTIENEFLAIDPLHALAFRISKPPKGFPFTTAYKSASTVATLTDLGQGKTRLRLAMNGFTTDDESQKMRAFFEQGNGWVMDKLKKNMEGSPVVDPVGAADAKAASLAPAGDLDPIILETTVAAMPSEVWKCWTTSQGMKSFLTDANIDLKIGGPFELYFSGPETPAGQRGSEGCTILSYEPNSMLSFSWNAPPKFAHARAQRTWVVLHITPHGPHSTKVTLKHMGFADQAAQHPDHAAEWKEVRAYFTNAWPFVLKHLKDHYASK